MRTTFEVHDVSNSHDELLTLWASGDGPERRAALEHVRQCAACRAESERLGKAIDALEGGTVGRVAEPAPKGGVARLLSRARGGRLSYFEEEVARLFDVSLEAARALLERAARGDFPEQLAPGVHFIPVVGGPRVATAMTTLVRIAPGATFPQHPHLGHEEVRVLEGGYRDSSGREVWRGEVQEMDKGTEHHFVAFDDVGCLCASVIHTEGD